MHCCKVGWGLLILLLGVGLLLKDLGVWAFWNLTPWSLLFLVAGLALLCKGMCKCEKAGKKK